MSILQECDYQMRPHILDAIRGNKDLKNAIRSAFGISDVTLWTWLKDNYILLTTKKTLKLVSHFLNLNEDELIELKGAIVSDPGDEVDHIHATK